MDDPPVAPTWDEWHEAAKKALAGYGLFWSAVDEMEGPKAFQAGTAPTIYAKGRADSLKGTALDPHAKATARASALRWGGRAAVAVGLIALGVFLWPFLQPTPTWESIKERARIFKQPGDTERLEETKPTEKAINLESGKWPDDRLTLRVVYMEFDNPQEADSVLANAGLFRAAMRRKGRVVIAALGDKAQEFLKGL